MYQIFEIRQDRNGAKPYTFGITSASNWMWSLALEKAGSCPEDVYSIRNRGLEVARIFWVGGKLAIGYTGKSTVVPIRVDGEFLKPNSLQSKTLLSGSLIILRDNSVIEVQNRTALAKWLGSYNTDQTTLLMDDEKTLAFSSALAVWREPLIEDISISHIARAVLDKWIIVTGQRHALDTVREYPEPLWVQLGQTWKMEGSSQEMLLPVARTFEVVEVGIIPDPTEPFGFGRGAKVRLSDDTEVYLPQVAFEQYATLLV